MHACLTISCITSAMLIATVAIDVSKLYLLVVMLACMLNKIIYCISSAMLNTVAIYVSQLSIPISSDACMLKIMIYCISSAMLYTAVAIDAIDVSKLLL